MLLVINDVKEDPYAVELFEVLRKLGTGPGGSPDQAAIYAIAA